MDYSSIRLDKGNGENLFGQLHKELLRLITLLPHHSEEELLSERQLCELLELSRPTVHQAYVMLESSGVVRRRADKSLHVVPNARQLLCNPFPMIGVFINGNSLGNYINEHGQLPLYFMSGIHDRASELNYSIVLLNLPGPEVGPNDVRDYLENIVNRMCGVIHLGDRNIENDKPLEQLLKFTSVPQVFISGHADLPGIGSLEASPEKGIRELCVEMKKRGMSTIGILKAFAQENRLCNHLIHEARNRQEKIKGYLKQNGIQISPEACALCPDRHSLQAFLYGMKEKGNLPHVLLCRDDQQAQAACSCLRSFGVSIPQDVSVVGYSANPELHRKSSCASISFPYHAMGSAAVSMLNDFFLNGVTEANSSIILDTHFLQGKTFRNC